MARSERRGRLFVLLERTLLSVGMSVVAFVVERRLLKALKEGFKPAPRTAAGGEEPVGEQLDVTPAPVPGSAAPAEQVDHKSQR